MITCDRCGDECQRQAIFDPNLTPEIGDQIIIIWHCNKGECLPHLGNEHEGIASNLDQFIGKKVIKLIRPPKFDLKIEKRYCKSC